MENKNFTHKATLIMTSTGADDSVQIEVVWEPDLVGLDIEKLGYLPAAYQFVEEHILPALEEAYLKNEFPELMEPEGKGTLH